MALLKPFRAYRPAPADALAVACPPYDVIDTAEARALAAGNDASFLHVTRPEIDLPEGTDDHADEVYAQGATNLARLVADGFLRQDGEPLLYLYEQRMGAHVQVGVVGCAAVAEYLSGRIKKHENTRADKEDDRTRHIGELGAHDEPVFLTYLARADIDALVEAERAHAPVYDFVSQDGVGHRFWALSRGASLSLEKLFSHVEALYVADGHHRSAAAARVHAERRGDGGEHDVFLAVVFPHDQMQILPYNRVVRDTRGRSPEQLLAELGRVLHLEPRADAAAATPSAPREFGLFLGEQWYLARVPASAVPEGDPVASLDCSLCQDLVLGPLFDVTDPRRDKHVEFVGGIRGPAELERRVRSGHMTLGIHLYPTQIEQLFAVSDAGLLMPPKSTWFEPKLRSGLFVHTF